MESYSSLRQPEERRYNEQTYAQDVEMTPAEEDEESEEELYSDVEEGGSRTRSSSSTVDRMVAPTESVEDEAEDSVGTDEESGVLGKRVKNSQLAVGHRDNLSFVVRGDMIGVFQAQAGAGRKLKFMTNIQGVGTPDGKRTFTPGRVRHG